SAEQARLLERRQQADGEAGEAHHADGEQEDHLAAETVSDESEEDTAEGSRRKSDAIGCERCDQCTAFAQGLEEQRSEDQGRSQTINVEVVVLQSGSYGAGKSCPSQLFR